MGNEKISKISAILAAIFSLVGAILLLTTPWAYWWYSYRSYGWLYRGSGVVAVGTGPETAFIVLAALFLLICCVISIIAFIPGKITSKTPMIISLIIAFIVLIMFVIGAVITAAIHDSQGVNWEFGPAFYGGISCTLLTVLFSLIMIYTWEK
jgi:hypothetical protein